MGQRVEQVLLIDIVGKKGDSGRVDLGIPEMTVPCSQSAKSTTTPILLLFPDILTPKESETSMTCRALISEAQQSFSFHTIHLLMNNR